MELYKRKKAYKKGLVLVTFKEEIGFEEAQNLIIKQLQLKIKENHGIVGGKLMLVVEVVKGKEQKWVNKFPRMKKYPIVESAERIPTVDLHTKAEHTNPKEVKLEDLFRHPHASYVLITEWLLLYTIREEAKNQEGIKTSLYDIWQKIRRVHPNFYLIWSTNHYPEKSENELYSCLLKFYDLGLIGILPVKDKEGLTRCWLLTDKGWQLLRKRWPEVKNILYPTINFDG